MRISIECMPCLLNQAVRMTRERVDDRQEQKRLMQKVLQEMADSDENASAPYVAHRIQRVIRQALQDPDPYREGKRYYNTAMLKMEDCLGDLIAAADDKLCIALKLAAAGNVIDFGPGYDLSRDKVLAVIRQTMEQGISPTVFAALQSSLAAGRRLLYLGDNCGEIVLDKLFIRTLKEHYPHLEVQFAARGGPVLNDITREDAYLVGMDEYAEIVDNGTDIQGTELAYCSPEFVDLFHQADTIIAKGQGNFESLYGCDKSNLYYIFLCKCNLFMDRCGARQNEVMLVAERGPGPGSP